MAVIRVEKTKNYTVMSNYHLRDKNLSLKAKGLLSFMLSLPEEWDYTEMGLVACLKEGRDGIRAALQELQEHGYLQRRQLRNANGKMGGTEYTVREKPLSGNPTSVNPISVNPTQINTKVTSKERINTDTEEEEAEWQEVLKCYQNNIYPIFGSIDMEKLSSLYKDFGKDWVMSAIEECVKNNVRNLNYLSRILERWGRDGYKVDNRRSKSNEAPRELSFEEQVAQMEAARQKRMALEEEYLRRMEEAERNGKSAGNGEYTSGERTD